MDAILIDETQRELNIRHILKILIKCIESMVMAIQVYEDPERHLKYIAWDGQHTIIALFIIQQKYLVNVLQKQQFRLLCTTKEVD